MAFLLWKYYGKSGSWLNLIVTLVVPSVAISNKCPILWHIVQEEAGQISSGNTRSSRFLRLFHPAYCIWLLPSRPTSPSIGKYWTWQVLAQETNGNGGPFLRDSIGTFVCCNLFFFMVGIMSFYHNWMHFPLTSQSLSFFVGLQAATNCLLGFKISELRKPQVGKNHSGHLGSSWIINRTFPSVWWNRPENYCGSSLREASLKKASFLRGLQSDSSSLVHLYDAGLSLKKLRNDLYSDKEIFIRYFFFIPSVLALIKYHPGL